MTAPRMFLLRKLLRNVLLCVVCLGLLAGCSRSSLITVDVDALSFMATATRDGALTLADDEVFFPDTDGIASSDLGLSLGMLEELQRFETHLRAMLTLQGATGGETVRLSLHIVEEGEGPLFSEPPIAETTVTLLPGEAVPVDFEVLISEAENAEALAILRSGHFRLGLRLALDTGSATNELHYALDALDVEASMKAAGVFPF